jgi:hypothetical protein
MFPITSFYSHCDLTKKLSIPIDKKCTEDIIRYILTSSHRMDQLKQRLEQLNTLSFKQNLQQQLLDHLEKSIWDLTNLYLTKVK